MVKQQFQLIWAKLGRAALEWKRILRRSRRDTRAQKLLLGAVAFLAVIAVEILNVVRQPLALVMLALGLGVTFWIRRSYRRDDAFVFPLFSRPPAEAERALLADQVSELARHALVLACLLERVHGELYLRSHTVGENDEIILRRRVLAVAQRHRLLEGMEPEQRDLLLSPDGSWDDDAIAATLVLQESLRVLLWALQVTPLLSAVEDMYQLDARISSEAFAREQELLAAKVLRPVHELRHAARIALGYYTRCIAEQQRRGGTELDDPELRADLQRVAEEMQGESTDLLIGAATVGKSSEGELRLASAQSWRRWQTLEALITLAETGDRARLEEILGVGTSRSQAGPSAP